MNAGAKAPGSLAAQRTAAHKAKLAEDPRFAGWLNLLAKDDPQPDPAATARREERDELMRRACLAHLEMADRGLANGDPVHTQWCRDFVASTAPLGRPLGTGEPA